MNTPTLEEIELKLEPIFSALRTSKSGTEVSVLKAWAENVGGILPQLGKAWALADGEARELKVKAARCAGSGRIKSGEHLDALEKWAKAKGKATRLKALREDALEALNSIKASLRKDF